MFNPSCSISPSLTINILYVRSFFKTLAMRAHSLWKRASDKFSKCKNMVDNSANPSIFFCLLACAVHTVVNNKGSFVAELADFIVQLLNCGF